MTGTAALAKRRSTWSPWLRPLLLAAVAALALQCVFAARIAAMAVFDPQSTAFQRSEAWRMLAGQRRIAWSQRWQDYDRISAQLKRAVIASEDAGFTDHGGVDWDAVEKAWERNQRAEARQARLPPAKAARRPAKVIGGSTITQQLAKNLFLSPERTIWRKGQEFVLTLMLEAMLSKQRILEIYLNSVEWGEGVFGAQAAARHYFRVDAAQLDAWQAARLAVMLPAPKRFEKRPDSSYVAGRSATIVGRMDAVELP
jgi:monofunctional biosynthetic peptidoglycan transglycosylase